MENSTDPSEESNVRDMLSATKVAKLTKPGRYCDGRGLWLQVSKWKNKTNKSWIFQYASPTKTKLKGGREVACVRQFGLGPYGPRDVRLEEAREKAADARKQVRAGIDPIDAHQANRAAKRLELAKRVTFQTCADQYIASHQSSWRNEKHQYQWKATLASYVNPIIGALPVAEIDTALVLKVLQPIWETKTETAVRTRGRMKSILDWAKARGYRDGDNPARWKGHLRQLLSAPSKLRQVQHHPALPYAELPEFTTELRSGDEISARALEFAILTAVRTGEVIGAKWDEIDLDAKLWSIPAARMKANREHRVPLCDRVLDILKSLPREHGNPFLFIGGREGEPLSSMAMLQLLRALRPGTLTVHGFRSSFRDWAAETTGYPNHVLEMALAHSIGDKVEASYRRGDLFEKRKRLMTEWSKYCGQKPLPVKKTTNVTLLRAKKS